MEMNFGRWIEKQLQQNQITDSWLTYVTGLGVGAVRRWAKLGQTPRIDKFLIICEVLSNERGISIDDIIWEALETIPAYRAAKERQSKREVS
tara:strand:+ start:355 stop:630 length:276 start_codon:yes stop_codon:yes gene_type:complete